MSTFLYILFFIVVPRAWRKRNRICAQLKSVAAASLSSMMMMAYFLHMHAAVQEGGKAGGEGNVSSIKKEIGKWMTC